MRLTTPWTGLVWAGVLISIAATDGLMVQQEPHSDTQLYVAPATYTRREGKALPSTIIISRPLGVREDPKDDEVSIASEEDHSSEDDLDLKSNIKFYKIECTSGRSCTSIIPARTATARPPPSRAYDDIDIRKYLAKFSLRDGFQYTDDFESSGTPKEDETERHFSNHPATSSLDPSNPRAFGSSDHAMSNYWPGSAYRPRPLPSKGLVFKFQQYEPPRRTSSIDDFPNRRPAIQWDKIYESFPSRRPAMEWQKVPSQTFVTKKKKKPLRPHRPSRPSEPSWPYQSSRPNQQSSRPHVPFERNDNIIFPPYDLPRPSTTTRTTLRPPPYDGVWNRYSTSTVSQLDKDTGEWVKVSSSSTQLDKGVFERPTISPNTLPSPSYHTVASLTVLGLSDVRQPLSTFHDSTARDTHLVEVPSALPGRPPALIETDGGHADVMAAEDLSASSPRQTSSFSSSASSSTTTTTSPDSHTSVASSELSQVRRSNGMRRPLVLRR
ncbi:uncharacterized protein [Panulirus ornatus]|uniref:uncharacterized protein isoform X2 n=1 Tax=Panulirus ornatus TaxID=150431 RepID=UPI003A867B82